MAPRNLAARAGRWSAQHRKKAIAGWLAFVVLATLAGGSIGTRLIPEIDRGNGESRAADRAIDRAGFPDRVGEQVLVQGRGEVTAASPAFRAAVRDVVARLERLPHVGKVDSPLEDGNERLLSRDGRSALVNFEIDGTGEQVDERVQPTLAATRAAQRAHPAVRVDQYGGASAGRAFSDASDADLRRAETLSLPVTLAIVLLAFGALVAAMLPLALGLTAVAATIGLLGPVSRLVPLTEDVNAVIVLIGLAVGVDYAMFYVRREMEERAAGNDREHALEAAAATSGRAVLISGLTVMIAMAGMFLAGNAVFFSFAVGTILVVAVAVVGSLTFLPAMLSALSRKGWTEKGRVPLLARRRFRNRGHSRAWDAILTRVLRRPLLSAALAAAALVALAIPGLSMKTLEPGMQGLPPDLPVMRTYERIQAAFPGGPVPAAVVVRADDIDAPEVRAGIAALRRQALATGRMAEPIEVTVNPARTLAIVSIPMQGTGTDDTSETALETLRQEVIPATIAAVPGVRVDVTGVTAGSKDFSDVMRARLPVVFAFVLGLAFVLLMVTFRSIVVPLKAIVLNLLSVGAAYGVLKLVFQDGLGESLLGFQSVGGVISWLPLFLFVILFGLSMDYHVLIVSRVREAFDRGMSTDDAIAHGIKSTAAVVTSAAVVMVAVFSIFAALSFMHYKQLGVGLAAAVLIDATIVRAVLLPATMKLLGDWNWYLPRRLSWLPRLGHHGPGDARRTPQAATTSAR